NPRYQHETYVVLLCERLSRAGVKWSRRRAREQDYVVLPLAVSRHKEDHFRWMPARRGPQTPGISRAYVRILAGNACQGRRSDSSHSRYIRGATFLARASVK